ncbi:adenine phosphoribosyltransferase [Facilibium subflavum]|uniref:adenine phosphoribosyltransferase n=1 Tax=Facilibium subflavum TaxID=2219058 RepID=UPI000E65B65B|nr:adenine phosphoribosyltransferase [Facilibium subflavum]
MYADKLKALIESVPDFPQKGILFRDITPLLADPEGMHLVAQTMAQKVTQLALNPTVIAGPESRGFIFGVALAQHLSLGFVPIRKPGKLPRAVYECRYQLEYGQDALQVHKDAFKQDDRVLLVDDLLATGGTAKACVDLVQEAGASVAANFFLIELLGLKGRDKLTSTTVEALLQYP